MTRKRERQPSLQKACSSLSFPDLVLATSFTSLPDLSGVIDTVEQNGAPPGEELDEIDFKGCRDDVDAGWSWVVMVAGALTLFIGNGYVYSVGVFYLPLLEAFHEGEAMTALLGSVFIGLAGTFAVVGSMICNKLNCRIACMIGSCVAAGAFITSSFATSITFLIVSFGLIGGSGLIICYTSAHIITSHYFNKRRAFAIAVMHTGGSLGQVVWAPVTHFFIDQYTWRGACLLLGALALHLLACGALMRPHKYEYLHKKQHKTGCSSVFDLRLFKNIQFNFFALNILILPIAMGMIFVHFPAYAVYSGTSEHSAPTLLSVIGVSCMCCKLILGGALNHPDVDVWTIYTMSQTLVGLLTIAVPLFMSSYSGQMLYSLLFGTYITPFMIGFTPLAAQYVEAAQLGGAIGVLLFANGIGFFIGPVIGAVMYDANKSYAEAMQFAGGCMLANTLLMFLLPVTSSITQNREQKSETDLEQQKSHRFSLLLKQKRESLGIHSSRDDNRIEDVIKGPHLSKVYESAGLCAHGCKLGGCPLCFNQQYSHANGTANIPNGVSQSASTDVCASSFGTNSSVARDVFPIAVSVSTEDGSLIMGNHVGKSISPSETAVGSEMASSLETSHPGVTEKYSEGISFKSDLKADSLNTDEVPEKAKNQNDAEVMLHRSDSDMFSMDLTIVVDTSALETNDNVGHDQILGDQSPLPDTACYLETKKNIGSENSPDNHCATAALVSSLESENNIDANKTKCQFDDSTLSDLATSLDPNEGQERDGGNNLGNANYNAPVATYPVKTNNDNDSPKCRNSISFQTNAATSPGTTQDLHQERCSNFANAPSSSDTKCGVNTATAAVGFDMAS
ncbi:monocarboxylate transporter 1 [Lingula anatina]|uniref:Monocarboxylate transporter 1 n=1 Tax=Lingula anatina TaxID=7574 RepID=A0A1S3K7Q9_LINAN|nr:monocarboxylate transporter 1 [Lingula anatina]|eukprot:XP_013418532.1 monocarboxylate transporter 1 [Lingula anatina]